MYVQLNGGNNGLVDASALLWRLQLRGTGSQWRWREVTRPWMRRRTIGNRAFDLVHAVMALAGSKQHTLARQLAKRLKSDTMLRARSGNEELALAGPLAAAIMSFARGDYDGAVDSISAIRTAADQCGGSVAQCDLIHLTLLAGTASVLPGRWWPNAPSASPRAASIAGSRHARGPWGPQCWRTKRRAPAGADSSIAHRESRRV